MPFFLVLCIGYVQFTGALESGAVASMERIVDDHRQMIVSFLDERRADLSYILRAYPFDFLSRPENLAAVFGHLQQGSAAFVDIGVFDAHGLHVAYQGPYPLSGKVYRNTEWFRSVIEKGYFISDVFLGYRNVPHFVIALAREEAGRKWVVRATIDTQVFNELVRKVRIGNSGEAYILSAGGIFQTARRSGGALMDRDPDQGLYPPRHDGIRTFIRKDFRGEPYLYATTWLKDGGWMLVVRLEKADAFGALHRAAVMIVLTAVTGGAVIVCLAFFLTQRIVGRITRTDTEKGRLEEQLIRAHRLAELGQMAAGFAHEINNPLQIIKSEQALMEMNLAEFREKGLLPQEPEMEEILDSLLFVILLMPTPYGMKDVGTEYTVGPKAVTGYIVQRLFDQKTADAEQWQVIAARMMEQNMRMGALKKARFLARDIKWCRQYKIPVDAVNFDRAMTYIRDQVSDDRYLEIMTGAMDLRRNALKYEDLPEGDRVLAEKGAWAIKVAIAMAAFVVVCFLTECMPLPGVSLCVGLILVFTGVVSRQEVAMLYWDDAVWFIMGSLMFAAAPSACSCTRTASPTRSPKTRSWPSC